MASDAPVVLVTGASRGLGRAVADDQEERGARVHRVARSAVEGANGQVADLSQQEAAERVVRAVLEREGRIDAIVHAPGDYVDGTLEQLDAGQLERLFESNVTTAMHLIESGREALRASGGSWLFFGCAGLSGLRARRRTAGYGAVKSALVVLARSLALEEAPHGVRANVISPGLVPHADAHATTHAHADRVPLGRPTALTDIAGTAGWLLSAEASHITGQDIEVAGGFAL